MPWGERLTMQCGLKGREIVGPAFEATVTKPVVRNLFEVADDGRSAPRAVREVTKRAVLSDLQRALEESASPAVASFPHSSWRHFGSWTSPGGPPPIAPHGHVPNADES